MAVLADIPGLKPEAPAKGNDKLFLYSPEASRGLPIVRRSML
jgi:hypothetical protein